MENNPFSDFVPAQPVSSWTHVPLTLFEMLHLGALKHVTCKSFPWNKAGDFRPPILCPNMDKYKMEAARAGKCTSYMYVTTK